MDGRAAGRHAARESEKMSMARKDRKVPDKKKVEPRPVKPEKIESTGGDVVHKNGPTPRNLSLTRVASISTLLDLSAAFGSQPGAHLG
jgi:hypothetical protein